MLRHVGGHNCYLFATALRAAGAAESPESRMSVSTEAVVGRPRSARGDPARLKTCAIDVPDEGEAAGGGPVARGGAAGARAPLEALYTAWRNAPLAFFVRLNVRVYLVT